jgi:hypothetical protein
MLRYMKTCKNISTQRVRVWREANRTQYNQYMKDYRITSIGEFLSDPDEIWFERDARKRRALKLATPDWVDHTDIRRIYQKCMELNNQYPATGFVVHHIIPISHPKVCGLHIAENLKVVSLSMKLLVGRKFNSKSIGL